MMKQTLLIFLVVALLGNNAMAFMTPSPTTRATSSLNMGLFDAFMKPKKDPKKDQPKGGNIAFLEGKGKRITIREDEDNAMWIEDKDGNRKKAN